MNGFTYLMTDDHGIFKIGYTNNLKARLAQMNNTSTLYNFRYLAWSETEEYKTLEAELHKQYRKERVRKDREFFTLTEAQIIEVQKVFVIRATGKFLAPDTPEHEEIKRLEEIRRETARLVKEAARARRRAAEIEIEEKQAATQAAAMKVWEEEAPKREAADRKKKTIEALLVWAAIIIGIIVYNMYPDQGFMALTIFFTLMIFPYPLMALEKIIYYCIDKIKTR